METECLITGPQVAIFSKLPVMKREVSDPKPGS